MNDNMETYDYADKRFDVGPFNPFKWNEYTLDAVKRGKTKAGNDKYLFVFKSVNSDNAVFHTISYSADGKMNFQSDNEKILLALVQNNEKTYAEAMRNATGNKKVTVWLRCEVDGKYTRVAEAKKEITAEDKMNEGLQNGIAAQKDDDDDLPM